jgi:hypothetical protein
MAPKAPARSPRLSPRPEIAHGAGGAARAARPLPPPSTRASRVFTRTRRARYALWRCVRSCMAPKAPGLSHRLSSTLSLTAWLTRINLHRSTHAPRALRDAGERSFTAPRTPSQLSLTGLTSCAPSFDAPPACLHYNMIYATFHIRSRMLSEMAHNAKRLSRLCRFRLACSVLQTVQLALSSSWPPSCTHSGAPVNDFKRPATHPMPYIVLSMQDHALRRWHWCARNRPRSFFTDCVHDPPALCSWCAE